MTEYWDPFEDQRQNDLVNGRLQEERLQDELYVSVPLPENPNDHHIFPQNEMMREWFADRGINVHDYTVTLDRVDHEIMHKWWNQEWEAFMAAEPQDRHYTAAEIENRAAHMMEEAAQIMQDPGMFDYLHPYRNYDYEQ
jgi:hypothetical protein